MKNKTYRWEQKWVMYTRREWKQAIESKRRKNGQKQATFRKKSERKRKNGEKTEKISLNLKKDTDAYV